MCFALASYLTRERGKRVPRRLLEALFWPRMHASDASHSLSELIHKLRRKGLPIQRDDASCIWLPRDAAAIDIESLSAESLETIADRDLSILPGYEPRTSAEFSDW
ncbi:MAG TPA: helix-turn-helix domain-containing protein, partial [Gemmatimonadaceae bacterium]